MRAIYTLADCMCPAYSVLNTRYSRCECDVGYEGDATQDRSMRTIVPSGQPNQVLLPGQLIDAYMETSARTSAPCSRCPRGSFKANAGNNACDMCPIGAFIPLPGTQTGADGASAPGLSTVDVAQSRSNCVCPAHASMSATGGWCECDAGYGGNAAVMPGRMSVRNDEVDNGSGEGAAGQASVSTECTVCPMGTYKGRQANLECTACPLGSITSKSRRGAESVDECLCTSNASISKDGARCECHPGYKGDASNAAMLGVQGVPIDDACAVCGADYYKPLSGNNDCLPCPPLSSTGAVANATSIDACRCPLGYYKAFILSLIHI